MIAMVVQLWKEGCCKKKYYTTCVKFWLFLYNRCEISEKTKVQNAHLLFHDFHISKNAKIYGGCHRTHAWDIMVATTFISWPRNKSRCHHNISSMCPMAPTVNFSILWYMKIVEQQMSVLHFGFLRNFATIV